MWEVKLVLPASLVGFLGKYERYGFEDERAMARVALLRMQIELERQSLEQSAELYAEVYAADADLQALAEAALVGWPE